MSQKRMRLPYIDGLKGLGAIMVFLTHYRMMGLFGPYQQVWDNPLLTFIMSGNIAVELFIMISAYSIALSVERKLNSDQATEGLKSILDKRYFRLALPVAFILLLEGMLYPLNIFSPQDVVEQLETHPAAAKAYQFLNYGDLFKGILLSPIGKTYGWLSPAWMLSYIFYGTFITIIVKLAVRSMTLNGKIIFYTLFATLFTAISIHYLAIVIGCAFSEITLEGRVHKGHKGFAMSLGVIFTIGFIHTYVKSDVAHTLIASLVFGGVLFTKALHSIFSTNVALWIGKISFSIYLIHWPLICSFSVWEFKLLGGMNPEIKFITVFCSTVIVLFLLSKWYHVFIENKLCSALMNKISKVLK